MDSTASWPVLILVFAAAVTDIKTRRVPNLLVLPFLLAGLTTSAASSGWSGFGWSLCGVGLAILAMSLPVFLRGMGMGDLKLCAAVGAWIGPGQLALALVVMGIAGGIMALAWALFNKSLGESLDGMNNLMSRPFKRRSEQSVAPTLDNSDASRKLPYAPAIAIGTAFSFFAQ